MNTVLGDKLKELRREKKISQQKVSYRTHISPVQLSRYENNFGSGVDNRGLTVGGKWKY